MHRNSRRISSVLLTNRVFSYAKGNRHQSSSSSGPGQTIDWPYCPPSLQSGQVEFGPSQQSLMMVHGRDTNHFLNGLITRGCDPWDGGFYGAFLTRVGRVLTDGFIYPLDPDTVHHLLAKTGGDDSSSSGGYLIGCDSSRLESLYTHLRLRKLHSKLSISKLPGSLLSVGSIWNETWNNDEDFFSQSQELANLDPFLVAPDVRMANTLRYIRFNNAQAENQDHNLASYTQRRYLYGVASTRDLVDNLPFDYNLDKLDAINFEKGCYLGQELTIRTFHRGIIRKRLMPGYIFPIDGHGNESLTDLPSHVNVSMDPGIQLDDSVKLTPWTQYYGEQQQQQPALSPSPFSTTPTTATRPRKSPEPAKLVSTYGNLALVMARDHSIENLSEPFVINDGKYGLKLLCPFWKMLDNAG